LVKHNYKLRFFPGLTSSSPAMKPCRISDGDDPEGKNKAGSGPFRFYLPHGVPAISGGKTRLKSPFRGEPDKWIWSRLKGFGIF